MIQKSFFCKLVHCNNEIAVTGVVVVVFVLVVVVVVAVVVVVVVVVVVGVVLVVDVAAAKNSFFLSNLLQIYVLG